MGARGKIKLMEIPFNPTNINLFGTKALGQLFTSIEMAEGYVEPSEAQTEYQALDQNRIDIIKS